MENSERKPLSCTESGPLESSCHGADTESLGGKIIKIVTKNLVPFTVRSVLNRDFSEHIVKKSTLAQSTGSRELRTHRTIADGE